MLTFVALAEPAVVENVLLFFWPSVKEDVMTFLRQDDDPAQRGRRFSLTTSAHSADAEKPVSMASARPVLLHPSKEPRHNGTVPVLACRERSSGNAERVQSECFKIPLGLG